MKKTKDEKNTTSNLLVSILAILVILTVGIGGYAYNQLKNDESVFHFKKEEKQELYALEAFTLKLADGRNATITMTVGYTGKKTGEELKEKTPILRDKIILETMKLESGNFQSSNLEKTKTKLVEKVSPLITEGTIQTVYFTDLMIL